MEKENTIKKSSQKKKTPRLGLKFSEDKVYINLVLYDKPVTYWRH